MTPEILSLVEMLRLSRADLLGIAREVAENSSVQSVEELTSTQLMFLDQYLRFLARPVKLRNTVEHLERLVA